MNPDKAREHFSAYYEGTLEPGLGESFERALRSDSQVQAEYRSFERLMKELNVLKEPVPEPELDLHEIISRRLDLHIHEQKRRVTLPILGWWKSLAMGGLATLALAATIWQLQSNPVGTNTKSVAGGITAGVEVLDRIELTSRDGKASILYRTNGRKTMAVTGPDGGILARQMVDGGSLTCPLDNPNESSKLLRVEVLEDADVAYVALPGKKAQSTRTGEGTVKDLGLAFAGFYRVPVMIVGEDATPVKWSFTAGEPLEYLQKALSSTEWTAHENADGVISIHLN